MWIRSIIILKLLDQSLPNDSEAVQYCSAFENKRGKAKEKLAEKLISQKNIHYCITNQFECVSSALGTIIAITVISLALVFINDWYSSINWLIRIRVFETQ